MLLLDSHADDDKDDGEDDKHDGDYVMVTLMKVVSWTTAGLFNKGGISLTAFIP